MKIKNKIESMALIRELGCNHLPEIFLPKFDREKIQNFLDNTRAEIYIVRDRAVAASPKAKDLKPDEVIDYCESNMDKFSVCVSQYNYRKYQVCVGEIHIHGDTIDYIVSNNPELNIRNMLGCPDYNGTTDIFDKKLRRIPGMDEIICYIMEHNLVDIIVEFTVFNQPVGIKNEKICIWELRTDY